MRRVRIQALLTFSLMLALLILVVGRTAHAATITVTNTADDGLGSLRQAIALAASGDTIDFALGGCPCTITLTTGELVIDKNLTISGPGLQLTVDANGTSRVFKIAPGVVADIGGLQVTGGNAQMGGIETGPGGGFWVQQATLTLRNAVVTRNHADHGGAISYEGGLTVINSDISENTSLSVGGGIHGDGTLTLTNSNLVRNHARWGGGVYLLSGTLRVIGGAFVGNDASRQGGAVFIGAGVQATILDSTIRDNRAASGGGIISGGTLAIVNSTISNNSSYEAFNAAGGVYSLGSLTVANSTISGNVSEVAGPPGGVFTNLGSATIVNSTIVLNQGGGIVVHGDATAVLSNTIVAGNTVADVGAVVDTANNNTLIADQVGVDVSSIIDTTLADNGGPTQTHALVENSAAIGAGSNTWLPADAFDLDGDGDTSEPIPVDQRGVGFPRLQGIVDIGAVEAACPAIAVTPNPPPNGMVGAAYSQSLSSTGGKSPHTFSAASLPAGLTLSSGGLLSGTPTTAGTFTIAVTVVEDGGCARTIELTLTVVEDTTCGITVGPATLQTPYVATLYYQPISASPSGQYTYSVSSGALPLGLYLFSVGHNGVIGGFPTMPGTYTFTIKAKKKNSPCESTRTYTVTVPVTVAPQLTCVVKTGNKQYTARFGYDNSTGAAVTIPVGADNYFTPGTQNRGQVTVFQPGKVTNAFSVTFTVSGKNSDLAIWFVKGPDGVKRPVNITTATFPCP